LLLVIKKSQNKVVDVDAQQADDTGNATGDEEGKRRSSNKGDMGIGKQCLIIPKKKLQ
jgi:hypothetical protein